MAVDDESSLVDVQPAFAFNPAGSMQGPPGKPLACVDEQCCESRRSYEILLRIKDRTLLIIGNSRNMSSLKSNQSCR